MIIQPLKLISGCRQAISTLFDEFLIVKATYFNLHLPNFAKFHYFFEFDRRQTVFLRNKMFRAVRMMQCDV